MLIVRHAAIAYVDTDGQQRDTVAANPPLTHLGERQADALALPFAHKKCLTYSAVASMV